MSLNPRQYRRSRIKCSAQVLSIYLLMGLGLVVTAVLFWEMRSLEGRNIQERFIRAAERKTDFVIHGFKERLFVADSLKALYQGSDSVSRSEFREFVEPLLPYFRDAQSLQWVPFISVERRFECEQQARRDGIERFQITCRDADGNLIRAPQCERGYFPAYNVEPYFGNEALLGFDLASDPFWRALLEGARDAGRPEAYLGNASSGLAWQGDILAIVQPVFRQNHPTYSQASRRENLRGFVVAVFDLQRLVSAQLDSLEANGIDVEVVAGSQTLRLWHRQSSSSAPPTTPSEMSPSAAGFLRTERTFSFPGKRWLVRCIASEGFLAHHPFRGSNLTLIIGLILTLALTVGGKRHLERADRIARLVRERTQELDRSRAELKSHNEFLKNILAALTHPLHVIDANDYTIRLSNQAAEGDIETPKRRCAEMIHGHPEVCDDCDWPCAVCAVRESRAPCVIEVTRPDPEGDERVVEVHGYPIFDDSGAVVQVIECHLDTTSRKHAEEIQRERSEELAAIYDNAPMVMMLVDGERRVRKANRFAVEFAQRVEADMIGQFTGGALRCLHSLDDPGGCGHGPACDSCMVRRTVIDTLETGRSHAQVEARLPFTLEGREQELVFLLSTARVRVQKQWMVLVGILDITSRKKVEQRLAGQLAFTETLLNTIPSPVYYKDREGRYLGGNQAFLEFVGLSEAEIFGKTVFDVSPKDLAVKYDQQDRKLFDHPGVQHYEWPVRSANGRIREVMFDKATFRDAAGEVAGLIGVISDITALKRVQEELRTQKDLLTQVLSHIPAFVFWKDMDSVYLGCNEAFARSTGLDSPEAIVGKTDYDCVWKNEADFYRQCDRETMERGQPLLDFEETQTQADGSQITLLTSKVPLRDDAGKVTGVLGIYSDITERKRAQEEIAILARFTSENPCPVLRVHYDGTLIYANPASASLLDHFGIAAGEALPVDWVEIVKEVFEMGMVRREELTCGDKTYAATVAPVSEGRYVNVYALDITGRRQAEEAVEQHRLFLQTVLDSFSGNVVVLDSQGHITMVNHSWVQFAQDNGAAPDYAFEGIDYLALCREAAGPDFEGADEAAEGIERILRGHGACFKMEYPCHGPTEKRWFQLRASPFDFQGSSCAVIAHIDITERKLAEQRQAALLNELEDINAELGDFAHIVSHDLKAPLRGIRTLAEWMVSDYAERLGNEGKEQLDLLMTRVDRMHNLINGILQYSRVSRNREARIPVDLRDCVARIIDDLAPPDHVSIVVDDALPTVEAEGTRMVELFQNLLSNAIKYMDKEQGAIHVGCADDGAFWRFCVADNGPGIPECHFERVFQVFQTLAPRDVVESTGVGLAIVKKIVDSHGGRIWVESQVGQGSTFLFTLPKAPVRRIDEVLPTTTAC